MKSVFAVIAVVFGMASMAYADSGSNSGSCSGNIQSLGYFYAYTYQYAYLYQGKVGSESHSFSFSGFLSDMKNSKPVEATESHIIYRGDNIELAVPYKSGAGLYMRKGMDWVKLCSY